MPRDITITLQDGSQRIYKGAPDDVTPDAVIARAQKEFGQSVTKVDGGRPAPEKTWLDTAIGLGKAALTGVAKSATSIAGLPALGRDLMTSGTNAIVDTVAPGVRDTNRPTRLPNIGGMSWINNAPTTEQMNKALGDVVGGLHKPGTRAEKYAETIGSFAPAAIGGPGGAVSHLARAVVPGAASEFAGQMTEGTEFEPWARLAGGVAGSLGTGAVQSAMYNNAAIKAAPKATDLDAEASSLFKSVKDAGINIRANAYDDLVDDIEKTVKAAGTHPKLHPKVDGALDSLKELKGQNVPFDEISRLRRIASGAAGSIERDERRVARLILEKIDDFSDNLSQSQVTSNQNVSNVGAALKEARSLWSRMRKSETIETVIDRAKSRATTQNGNLAAALRQEFGALYRNDKRMRGFTPEERRAIGEISKVGPTKSAIIGLGALRPRGLAQLVQLGGVGASVATSNPMVAAPFIGTAIAGQAAQSGLNASTMQQANLASALMRAGPGSNIGAQASQSPLIAALLSQSVPRGRQ